MNDIGYRICKLRKVLGISQDDFAKIIDVSTKTLGRYEKGVSSPGIETLKNISNFLGVQMEYFLGLMNYYDEQDFESKLDEVNGNINLFNHYVNNINNHVFEDDDYYWIIFDRKTGMLGGHTTFVDWKYEKPRYEIRKLRTVDTDKVRDILESIGLTYMTVNSELDLRTLFYFGEQGLIKKTLCEDLLENFIYYVVKTENLVNNICMKDIV